MRPFYCGLACSVVMIFLGSGVFGYDGQDRPVSSNDQGGPRPHIRKGVVGRVTAFDGHPVAGALIGARSLDDPGLPIPEIAILSDGDGRYIWPLFPGTYEISVSAEGYRRASQRVVVKAGEAVTVDFTLTNIP